MQVKAVAVGVKALDRFGRERIGRGRDEADDIGVRNGGLGGIEGFVRDDRGEFGLGADERVTSKPKRASNCASILRSSAPRSRARVSKITLPLGR